MADRALMTQIGGSLFNKTAFYLVSGGLVFSVIRAQAATLHAENGLGIPVEICQARDDDMPVEATAMAAPSTTPSNTISLQKRATTQARLSPLLTRRMRSTASQQHPH